MSEQLLRIADVCKQVGLGRSTVYRRIKAGTFPRPLDLDAIVAWRSSDIAAWIDRLKATSDAPPTAPTPAASRRAADRPNSAR